MKCFLALGVNVCVAMFQIDNCFKCYVCLSVQHTLPTVRAEGGEYNFTSGKFNSSAPVGQHLCGLLGS